MSYKKHFDVPMMDDDDTETSRSQFSKFRKLDSSEIATTSAASRDQNTNAESKFHISECSDNVNSNYTGIRKAGETEATGTSSNVASTTKRSVIVSGRQKGNPLLRFLRNVPWEWGDISGDYQIGASCCLLFLSAKYHKLHSEYIHQRFKKIGRTFANQILLFLIDVDEPKDVLREINSMCFLTECWTLLLCWSYEECAEYVESLKIYENKPTEFLMVNEKTTKNEKPNDFAVLVDLLTTIRSVTKVDAESLIDTFGSLKNIVEASVDQLALCRGVGLLKAKRIYDAFGQPFSTKNPANDVDLAIKQVEIDDFDIDNDG